ncbi:MAG: HD domain-containing protein, partial [Candidatus Omnitrophica bacterium]|nr:HD domain-containing protein [Candidatus Omnitrophota bacterium]
MVRLTNQFWDNMWKQPKESSTGEDLKNNFVISSEKSLSQQTLEQSLVQIKQQDLSYTEKLYIELFELTHQSLRLNINKDHIETVIRQIIDVFVENPYNELLLYSYSISKENYIIAHITNNVLLALGFGSSLNLSKNNLLELGIAAFCHDFGMADYTHLFQSGQPLSEKENKLVQRHPFRSAEIFESFFSERILTVILDVHEYVNGGGYPQGKKGDDISFFAKVISICDVFEALTHPRNFRKAYSPYEAMKMIIKKKDIIFDGAVIKKFLEYMSIYPIGSLVYLNTGETAMVIGSNRGFPTRSIVQVLLNAKREVNTSGKIVNLLQDKMIYING